MFKFVTMPKFNADGVGTAGSSNDWGSFLRSVPENDVQPETDTDTETLDEGEEQEEVEELDDSSNDHTEDAQESEEEAEDSDTVETPIVEDDPDVEMGEGRKSVKMSELKNGYLRQADYTKKTQELATQRKEVETMRDSLKGAESWHNHMQANPWLWNQITQAMEVFNQTGVAPLEEALADAQYGHYINHLMAENTQLKREMEGLRGDYEGVKLTSEMSQLRNELKSEYGELVTDDYMKSLQDRAKAEKLSSATLKEIAEGHLAKQQLKKSQTSAKKISKEAEARTIQKLQETRTKSPTSPKVVTATPGKEAAKTGGSWGDFLRSLAD